MKKRGRPKKVEQKLSVVITRAEPKHQKAILNVAKLSEYTKKYAEVRFIDDYYKKGNIIVPWVDNKIAGFALFRHLVNKSYTSLYYMGVVPSARGQRIGYQLLSWIASDSPHTEMRCSCEKINPALQWYQGLGFNIVGEGMSKQGLEHWDLLWTFEK